MDAIDLFLIRIQEIEGENRCWAVLVRSKWYIVDDEDNDDDDDGNRRMM